MGRNSDYFLITGSYCKYVKLLVIKCPKIKCFNFSAVELFQVTTVAKQLKNYRLSLIIITLNMDCHFSFNEW